ncbi:MAG: thiamine pyrophosphate-binding protein [Cyanobacteriota bacterium]|nr:thiamine pyrophosphate-binding protein [Cyanobacteriota bacterium]
MDSPTVAHYTLSRLSRLGIDRIFGVPGDYAFSINNAAEQVEGLAWVGCTNELNAAYAADGYARIRGRPSSPPLMEWGNCRPSMA